MSEELSAMDLSRLEDAFYAVLTLVAGADGTVDPKEARRFTQMLEAVRGGDEPLLARLAAQALSSNSARLPKQALAAAAAAENVRAAASVADTQLSAEAAQRFKQGLYLMGKQLAEASGGGVLGLRGRTSEEERTALAELAALLGV
ncbi:MAG TPA: hypothetical protein VF331_09525 [Polyangiales bacterium]